MDDDKNDETDSHKTKSSGRKFLITIIVISVIIGLGLWLLSAPIVKYDRGYSMKAKAFISGSMVGALETFYLDIGVYPKSLHDLKNNSSDSARWNGPYVQDSIKFIDPWGNPYNYQNPRKKAQGGYDLWSNGPDGQSGTADDIGNWE